MVEERFKRYIQEFERGTTCTKFISKQQDVLDYMKKNDEIMTELTVHNALSNEKRFLIYKLLEKGPMCTCALASIFKLSDGTITHHLKILEDANLIFGKKEGYFTRYYALNSFLQENSNI